MREGVLWTARDKINGIQQWQGLQDVKCLDIAEQGNSDGCRGWEVGKEGTWLKDVDVAAWFTLLSLGLAYTLAAVLTWASLTAEERWLGRGATHISLLSNPEKHTSPLQKVLPMLCCHVGKSKYVYVDACTWEIMLERGCCWNEISSYHWDFIASFHSVYFHGKRHSLFFSHLSSISIADHKEFWLLFFIQPKRIFF